MEREVFVMEYVGAVTSSVVFVSLFLGLATLITFAWRYFFGD
jgi:hypothetical protein